MAEVGSGSYVMGRSPSETQRLQAQDKIFGGYTERFLRMAGVRPGMRILDIGCGPGDVTMTAARIAGESGGVTGVDADDELLAVATRRAAAAGMRNVSFTRAVLPDVPLEPGFDAVIGRFILVHLDQPAVALRAVSRLAAPGAVVAFQDLNITRMHALPRVPLVTACTEWICTGFRAGGRNPDSGWELFSIFRDAGLAVPEMNVAVHAASDQATCDVIAAVVASLMPLIERAGTGTRQEVDPDTLALRLREEVRAADAAIIGLELAGAWTRTPARDQPGVTASAIWASHRSGPQVSRSGG